MGAVRARRSWGSTHRCPTSPTAASRRASPKPTGSPSVTAADPHGDSIARMPAFGRVLSRAQITNVGRYVKGFCRDAAWPAGELNLPRDAHRKGLSRGRGCPVNDDGVWGIHQRVSVRAPSRRAHEYQVRCHSRSRSGPEWNRGLGDIAAAVKHVLFHSRNRGSIVSAAAGIVLPTGKENEGLEWRNGVRTVRHGRPDSAGRRLPAGSGGLRDCRPPGREPRVFWRGALARVSCRENLDAHGRR